MNSTTECVVRKRLREMAKMARELRKNADEVRKLAQQHNYVRIGGDSYRAVSLLNSFPLCGISKSGSRNLETVLGHFSKTTREKLKDETLKRKEERRLQCWLIREALLNDGDLMEPLGLDKEHFDKLLFALDEVSVGDNKHPIKDIAKGITLAPKEKVETINAVRCDILAVGVIGNEVFPVVIELKSSRDKKRLKDQLDNFGNLLAYFQDEFCELLQACTGQSINSPQCRKILVWPAHTKYVQKTIDTLHEEGIGIIEYSEPYNFAKYLKAQ